MNSILPRFSIIVAATMGVAILGASLLGPGAKAEETERILTRDVSEVAGPKRTIAVGKMEAVGAYKAAYGGQDVGASLGAMLSTALSQSERFIVVERAALSQVLTEQELAASGLTEGSAAAKPGKLTPVQYLVVGAVTEFGTDDEGSSVSIGGTGSLLGGALSLNDSSGSVAIDLRVVETLTAKVVRSFQVRREISSTGVGATAGYKNVALGGSKFWKTPIGQATREALNDAVVEIAKAVATGKWQGQVVEVEKNVVYVNAGSLAGLKAGDRLAVEKVTKIMTDPATGEVLSVKRAALGTIVIDSVEEKIASGAYAGAAGKPPKRGDFVVFAN